MVEISNRWEYKKQYNIKTSRLDIVEISNIQKTCAHSKINSKKTIKMKVIKIHNYMNV